MGRVSLYDNYQFILDGRMQSFYASSVRQAWYLMFELSEGEIPDVFLEIDEHQRVVKDLLDEGDDYAS